MVIVRVEIPELDLSKAVILDNQQPLRELRIIINYKIAGTMPPISEDSRFFLPDTQLNGDDYLSDDGGIWILNESVPIGQLIKNLALPQPVEGSSISVQMRSFVSNNDGSAAGKPSKLSKRRNSSGSRAKASSQVKNTGSSSSVSTFVSSLNPCANDIISDSSKGSPSMLKSLRKKKSFQRLGRLFSGSSLSSPPSPPVQLSWFGDVKLEDFPLNPETGCPYIIEKLLQFIDAHGRDIEGVFRISGSSNAVLRLESVFQQSVNCGEDVIGIDKMDGVDVHVAATLLKSFLRRLPDPVMTFDLHPAWIQSGKSDIIRYRQYWIYHLLQALPSVHFTVLRRLCDFLNRFARYERDTQMPEQNLAMVFAPNILRTHDEESATNVFQNANFVNTVVLDMIRNVDTIFSRNFELENLKVNFVALAKLGCDLGISNNMNDLSNIIFNEGDCFLIHEPDTVVGDQEVSWWTAELIGSRNGERICGQVSSSHLSILGQLRSPVSLEHRSPVSSLEQCMAGMMAYRDAQTQTGEGGAVNPILGNRDNLFQLQKDNIQLRNEIIKLKSTILLLEAQAHQNDADISIPKRGKRNPPPLPPLPPNVASSLSSYVSSKSFKERPVTVHESIGSRRYLEASLGSCKNSHDSFSKPFSYMAQAVQQEEHQRSFDDDFIFNIPPPPLPKSLPPKTS